MTEITYTALDYVNEVLSGKRKVALAELEACKRWAKFKADPDIYYDKTKVEEVIKVFSLFRHTSGEYYGKRFQLLPWQIFVLSWVFGWKYKSNGHRVTRKAYIEVAKKMANRN